MGHKPARTPFFHNHHKKPVSRRELLGQGFLAATSSVMMPSLASLLFNRSAYARELVCSSSSESGQNRNVPFLMFDLAGGGNIAGSNVIVGKAGGQEDFLSTYATLGLPDAMSPKNMAPNKDFGLAFHPDSGMLRGMLSVITDPTVRANVEGAVFCTSSNDDTGNNPHNPGYWIARAGGVGELVALVGNNGSASGGRAAAPATSVNPAQRPVTIRGPDDVLGLVNPGKIATLLGDDKALSKILAATRAMSATRLAMFEEKDMPNQLKDLVECGYVNSGDLVSKYGPAALDPRQDQLVTGIFTNMTGTEGQVAAVTKLLLDGYAGVGTISMDGFDYHNGSRATGERRTFEAGVMIGKAIQLAAAKKQDLMIYVFTDGGVVASGQADNSADGRGKFSWAGDSGQRSASYAMVYKKDGKVEIRDNRRQIGGFKDSGTVDEDLTKISGSVENLSKAVVANYLALHGKEGDLAKVIDKDPFGSDLDRYLAFNKIR